MTRVPCAKAVPKTFLFLKTSFLEKEIGLVPSRLKHKQLTLLELKRKDRESTAFLEIKTIKNTNYFLLMNFIRFYCKYSILLFYQK
jgi:hypothetical protein